MNQERPNETCAKQIVERVMGIQLEHADTHGGVDYRSSDGGVALEVTAATNGLKKSARDALSGSETEGSPTRLQSCWIVFTADTQPKMKTLVQRVQPMVMDLEFAGETYFDDQSARGHVHENGGLSDIYRGLLDAGVEGAVCKSDLSEDPDHVHRICVSTGSGGSVNGSDETLAHLMEALKGKTDNAKKLRASGAEQRHLFVWLDDDTPYNIAYPLSRETPPSWKKEGWDLPTTKPQIDAAANYLWIVHKRSRLGWLWDSRKWRGLRDP